MHPIREDEDDILARLESRLDGVTEIISGLKQRNAELAAELRAASADRDAALTDAEAARAETARLREEAEGLRTRQKQAASRIKTLLNQVEQMDLLGEG